MFYSLTGNIIMLDASGFAVECGGVGFKCNASMNTLKKVGTVGSRTTVYTHLAVREDALELFAFSDLAELDCFKHLIAISGVGPKAALAVLSEMTPEKLAMAVSSGDGTVGKALALYGDSRLLSVTELVIDMLVNMNSSSEILAYSNKILQPKIDLSQFLSVLELMLRDMLVIYEGKSDVAFNKGAIEKLKKAQNFSRGALIHALESITEAQKRKKFNMNPTMLVEWLLFQILEGKYKWQKF